MEPEPEESPDIDSDSSEVVTGPVGSASLVEPTEAKDRSADLDRLPEVEAPPEPDGAGPR